MIVIHALLLPFVAVFWIFILWILWKMVQSLKGIDASLKEIVSNRQNKS
jgi:hypothetical protein